MEKFAMKNKNNNTKKNLIRILFLLFLMIPTFLFSQVELSSGLLLNYKFDGDVQDSSVNDFHGISYGITYVMDRHGQEYSSAYFNGYDAFVKLPNLSVLKPDLPMSISFWIKYEGTETENRAVFNTSLEDDRSTGVFFTEESSTGKYSLGFGDGDNIFNSSSRRSYVSESVIEMDKWTHIVLIIEGSTDMKIYVNGVDQGGVYLGTGGPLTYSNNPGVIGKHDQNSYYSPYHFKGSIDEFGYWNRVLTLDEIGLLSETTLSTPRLLNNSEQLLIYPNPSNDYVYISTKDKINKVELFDLTGRLVLDFNHDSKKLDIRSLPKGIYYFKVQTESDIFSRRIIKK